MSKANDVILPWSVAVDLFRPHLFMLLLKRNDPQGNRYTSETAKAQLDAWDLESPQQMRDLMSEVMASIETSNVLEQPVTGATRCGYYRCWEPKNDSGFCQHHNNEYCKADMTRYHTLLADGHSSKSAALQAGLIDPSDPD